MSIQEISHFLSLYLQGPATRPQREALLRSHVEQLKADVKDKEDKLAAASYMDTLLSEKGEAMDREDLPTMLRKKDIPDSMVRFFSRK